MGATATLNPHYGPQYDLGAAAPLFRVFEAEGVGQDQHGKPAPDLIEGF